MKAKNENGIIKVYVNLPTAYGNVLNGYELMTEKHEADGFFDVFVPELQANEKKGAIYFDENINAFTYPIEIIPPLTQAEIDAKIENRKTNLILKYEADTDELIKSIVGERSNEYEIAEQEAIIFKQAGYPDNDVPASISSDAIANGYSNTIACDIILDMANNWRSVQMALRSNRLLAKANTKNATTNEELDVAEQTWDGFLSYIKQQIT